MKPLSNVKMRKVFYYFISVPKYLNYFIITSIIKVTKTFNPIKTFTYELHIPKIVYISVQFQERMASAAYFLLVYLVFSHNLSIIWAKKESNNTDNEGKLI